MLNAWVGGFQVSRETEGLETIGSAKRLLEVLGFKPREHVWGKDVIRDVLDDLKKAEEKLREALDVAEQHGLEDIIRVCRSRLDALRENRVRILKAYASKALSTASSMVDECRVGGDCVKCFEALTTIDFIQKLARDYAIEDVAAVTDKALKAVLSELAACMIRRLWSSLEDVGKLAEQGEYRRALLEIKRVREQVEIVKRFVAGFDTGGNLAKHVDELLRRVDLLANKLFEASISIGVAGETVTEVGPPPEILQVRFEIPTLEYRGGWPSHAPRELVEKCYVLRELGLGGFGVVYEAHCIGRGRVVVKLPRRGADPASIVNEARKWLDVGGVCPHVVKVFEIGGVSTGTPYLVVEFCETTLSSLVPVQPANPEAVVEALQAIRAAAEALACAHERGVLHLDVKPDNIMKCSGEWKLGDWGAKPGEFTPGYAAPEQVRGGDVGPWTDVYQLGAIIYQVFTGKPPYGYKLEHLDDPSYPQDLWQLTWPFEATVPDWLMRLSTIAKRMVDRSPGNRPSMGEVVKELDRVLKQLRAYTRR